MSIEQRLKFSEVGKAARLILRLLDGYWKYVAIFVGLGFLSGILEVVGISALIPLFSLFAGNGQLGNDFVSQTILNTFSFTGIALTLPVILIFIVALFILKAGIQLLFHYIQVCLKTKYQEDLMNRLFKRTLYASWPYLLKQRQGNLETLLKIDVQQTAVLIESFVKIIMFATGFVIYFFAALSISETITFLAVGSGVLVFLVFKPIYFKGRVVARKTAEMNKHIAHLVNEYLDGMKVMKAMGLEDKITGIGSSFFSTFRGLQIRHTMLKKLLAISSQPITVIFVSIIVAFAYYQTSFNLGALAAIIYLIQRIFLSIQEAQTILFNINDAAPYAYNVLQYSEQATKHREVRQKKEEKHLKHFRLERELAFEDISFAYEAGGDVLHAVNFSIPQGTMVGLIGPSGAGKTTVFDIVLRLLEPTKGALVLDGVPVSNIDINVWRKHIAYVPQDIFLINGTVRDNIRFFDENISDEDVTEAAKKAYIYKMIEKLPKSFDTEVGERGIMLSAGQRQRIAIARALARKPQLLLLDEATSALDTESEQHIQRAIHELKGKVTVCVIAHRLSTVHEADMLYVLEDGRIIESGTPSDLLSKKETYFARMYGIRG